jgi:hypothetical protein
VPRLRSYDEQNLARKTLSDEFKDAEMRGMMQAKAEMHNDNDDLQDDYPKMAGSCAIQ